eukprot:3934148-Rhodomonas_salina.2
MDAAVGGNGFEGSVGTSSSLKVMETQIHLSPNLICGCAASHSEACEGGLRCWTVEAAVTAMQGLLRGCWESTRQAGMETNDAAPQTIQTCSRIWSVYLRIKNILRQFDTHKANSAGSSFQV